MKRGEPITSRSAGYTNVAFIAFYFFIVSSFGQTTLEPNQEGKARWEYSVSAGFSFLGPKETIRSQMIKSGFNDLSGISWLSQQSHPYARTYPEFEIEARRFLTEQNALALEFAMPNNTKVFGYDAIGFGHQLNIQSSIFALSPKFLHRSVNEEHTLEFGPSLVIHNIRNTNSDKQDNNSGNTDITVGLNAAWALQLNNKPKHSSYLKLCIRIHPNTTIEQIKITSAYTDIFNETTVYTSTFPTTIVNTSCINLNYGWYF